MRTRLAAFALAVIASFPSAAEERKRLVTILTAPDAQTQLMAMVLSMQSLKQGATVDMLLCGPAGDIALKAAPKSATAPQKPKGMSPQKLMKALMAQGGTVEVCAIYLPNKGVGGDALVDGIGLAKPPKMAEKLLAEKTRIMSF
jgi:predicted peroxiredoxin